jgi:hypothetical protein
VALPEGDSSGEVNPSEGGDEIDHREAEPAEAEPVEDGEEAPEVKKAVKGSVARGQTEQPGKSKRRRRRH